MAVKKIKASTIAEVVIAVTIIAVCFAVASKVFVQTNRSSIQFKEVKEQTEFQSMMLEALISDTLPDDKKWNRELSELEDEIKKLDSCEHHIFTLSSSQKLVWEQEIYYAK